ncbi:hypothetical protein CLV78_1011027 [Aliiruegeria haliotis]|uniref:Uncharacterized protein n=1 Tax=Aliiruegeria haliotis TaxID=1280846 RepID=A0A2T0S0M6_9RHOB|nr:hypothetical protein CLV78_1011027 [Aliiruegeria haliotis]
MANKRPRPEEIVTKLRPVEHGNLASHPEGSAKPCIAIFGDAALSSEHAGLHGCEVHAAELQELAVMAETAQIASFGQDGHGVDRTDAGNGCQQLVVWVIGQKLDSPRLDLIALSNPAALIGQHEAEHANGIGVRVNGQTDRANRCGVNI